jgi:VWFA-related protein
LQAESGHDLYPDEFRGPALLSEIAGITGGRAFAIDDGRPIGDAASALAREIHDQYVIGYRNPDSDSDGKHHRISVKVQPSAGVPRLSLFYRTGYRAPIEQASQ